MPSVFRLLQRSPDLAVGDGDDLSVLGPSQRVASTEPRPRGRGWEVAVGAEAPVQMLQRSPDLAVGDGATASPRRRGPSSFNGAPTSRSGMGPSSEECLERGRGFNGAPTSRSGMGSGYATPSALATRFNGAPTSRSGMALLQLRRGPRLFASTEPRPRDRGWSLLLGSKVSDY